MLDNIGWGTPVPWDFLAACAMLSYQSHFGINLTAACLVTSGLLVSHMLCPKREKDHDECDVVEQLVIGSCSRGGES